jgi:hypothetical protein
MMGGGRMKGKYVIVIISILLVSGMVLTSLNSDHDSSFPESLGEMKLISQVIGPEAIESIRQLHGNSEKVVMMDAAILEYRGGGAEATIWVSRTENNEEASSLMDAMNDAIDPGDGFSTSMIVSIPQVESVAVYYVYGYGSDHYYYLMEDRVYWIAVNGLIDDAQLEFVAEAINKLD